MNLGSKNPLCHFYAHLCSKSMYLPLLLLSLGEMQCYLYGHADVEPASGLKGNCYSLSGAEVIEEVAVSEVILQQSKL